VAASRSAQIREDREVFSRIRASKTTFSAFTVNGGMLEVKVLCTFFRHNSMSMSNFLRGNRFRCGFFTNSLSFDLH
jgi:hypothetical protein